MNKANFLAITDNILNFLIGLSVFFLPLYFNVFTWLNFEPDKIALFCVLTDLILIIYLLRALLTGRFFICRKPLWYWSVLSVFLIQIVATLASAYPHLGFWGSYQRRLGLFTYLHLFIFCFIFLALLNERIIKPRIILKLAALSGFFVSVYALFQAAGRDLLVWAEFNPLNLRPGSSLGQPNYLASYLLLVMPLVFYLWRTANRPVNKFFYLFILAIDAAAFYFTYSRAAALALAISFCFLGLFYFYRHRKKFFYLLIIILAAGCFVFLNVGPAPAPAPDEPIGLVSRLKSFTRLGEGGAGLRIFYYEAAIKIIKQSPWIGHGLETGGLLFFPYYRPEYALYDKINTYPDRAHSEILDILITTGVVGLAAWFWLWYSLFKKINLVKREEKFLAGVLFFSLGSFFVSILFGFFTAVNLIYFWLLVTMLFSLGRKNSKKIEIENKKEIWSILFLLVISLALWSVKYNLERNLADYYHRQAEKNLLVGNLREVFAAFARTADYASNEQYYRRQVAIKSLPWVLNLKDEKEKIGLMNDLTRLIINPRINETGFEDTAYLGILLTELGNVKSLSGLDGGREFSQADMIFSSLSSEAPGFARPYFDRGNVYFYQKDWSRALGFYYEALARYPDLARADLNTEHRNYIIKEMRVVLDRIIMVKKKIGDEKGAEYFRKKLEDISK